MSDLATSVRSAASCQTLNMSGKVNRVTKDRRGMSAGTGFPEFHVMRHIGKGSICKIR